MCFDFLKIDPFQNEILATCLCSINWPLCKQLGSRRSKSPLERERERIAWERWGRERKTTNEETLRTRFRFHEVATTVKRPTLPPRRRPRRASVPHRLRVPRTAARTRAARTHARTRDSVVLLSWGALRAAVSPPRPPRQTCTERRSKYSPFLRSVPTVAVYRFTRAAAADFCARAPSPPPPPSGVHHTERRPRRYEEFFSKVPVCGPHRLPRLSPDRSFFVHAVFPSQQWQKPLRVSISSACAARRRRRRRLPSAAAVVVPCAPFPVPFRRCCRVSQKDSQPLLPHSVRPSFPRRLTWFFTYIFVFMSTYGPSKISHPLDTVQPTLSSLAARLTIQRVRSMLMLSLSLEQCWRSYS